MQKRMAMAVMVIFGFVALAGAVEFPLEQAKADPRQTTLPGVQGSTTMILAKKPAEIRNAPAASSKRPLYGSITSSEKGKAFLFRLDESKAGRGYDRLIIDFNSNGDLRDDPVVEAEKLEGGEEAQGFEQRTFGPIDTPAKIGAWATSIRVTTLVFNRGQATGPAAIAGQMQVAPASYLVATVELNGAKEKIGLVDANVNFALGDAAVRETGYAGDVILRDRDGSGGFDADQLATESEAFASVVYFGGVPYAVTLADDLKSIKIEPYAGPVGELTADGFDKAQKLVLGRQVGKTWGRLTPQASNGVLKVPEGKYFVQSCSLGAKDANDQLWGALGSQEAPRQTVEVKAGQRAALAFGAPLELRTVARRPAGVTSLFTAPKLDINVEIYGAGGERYLMFFKGSEVLNPPRFKVVDTEGKQLAAGQLEYG